MVAPQGKIELSAEDGERAIHNRGKEVTYYLAWEHEDLSHPSNRYRDAPQQKDYDWMKLGTHVAAGLMIAGGIAALAAGGVLLLGAAAATAIKIGMTVFLAGSLYVGEQALSDMKSGRVSDLDQYTRKAVAGSVVGFLTGASGLLMAEASLLGVLALGFGEGLVGSIVTQKLLNEDGEIDWGVAIAEAGFSAVTAGLAWKERRSVRGVGGGGEALEGGTGVGNIAGKLDTNNIPNMTKQDIIDNIPDDWNYTEHNGFVHIRDADGNIRIRIDPPDKITNYPHVHAYDSDGNLLDSAGNIVDRKSPDGHIPYKDK